MKSSHNWTAVISNCSPKQQRMLLGLPNWTFPLFKALMSHHWQSLIHINLHFDETAHSLSGHSRKWPVLVITTFLRCLLMGVSTVMRNAIFLSCYDQDFWKHPSSFWRFPTILRTMSECCWKCPKNVPVIFKHLPIWSYLKGTKLKTF